MASYDLTMHCCTATSTIPLGEGYKIETPGISICFLNGSEVLGNPCCPSKASKFSFIFQMTLAVKIISVYEAGWQGFTSWYELWVWDWIFHRRMKTRLALIDIQATSAKLLRPLNPQLHKVLVIPEPHPVNLYQQFSPQRASSERHHSGCRIRSCTSSRRGKPQWYCCTRCI